MKNILKLLTISLLVIFASCDTNKFPEFDDSNSFVAFDNAEMSIAEDAETLRIPVTLASVNGVSASVNFDIMDGTAEEGVNYTLVSENKTLTFDAQNRTQFIEVSIINNPGVFTGDIRFEIILSDDGKVKPSLENKCTVTIQDRDHPLSAFLGEWTATATSNYFGDVQWAVTIAKDEDDVSVVWVTNIVYGFPNYGFTPPDFDTRFYATVNDDKDEFTFAIGQTCAYKYQNGHEISILGLTNNLEVVESGNIIATVSDDGNTISFNQLGIFASDATGGWDQILPGMTWTKNK